MRKLIFRSILMSLICLTLVSSTLSHENTTMHQPSVLGNQWLDKRNQMCSLLPKRMSGWKSNGPDKFYDRKTIFDYMDGTGELYLSYPFQLLLVRQYISKSPREPVITVELYDMGSSEDAFGIFSFERFDDPVGIGQDSEYGSGLLRFWKDKYLVTIYSEQETVQTKRAILSLGRTISKTIPTIGKEPELVSFLPREGLNEKSIRYFHLHSGLNHHYYIAEQNILNLNQYTNGIIAKYQVENDKPYVIIIQYSAQTTAVQAFYNYIELCNSRMPLRGFVDPRKAGKKGRLTPMQDLTAFSETNAGKWTIVKQEKEYLYLILNAQSRTGAENLITAIKPIKK
ncbi:MAG: hypothetical protein QME64_05835 [bacterium]|nr:hypothetical protein [bacterium]